MNASSPINADVQFTKNGYHQLPPFTIVNVYILGDLWSGYPDGDNLNNPTPPLERGIPGFDFLFVVLALVTTTGIVVARRCSH